MKLTVHSDGGYSSATGNCGCSYIIKEGSKVLAKQALLLKDYATVNQAEYMGAILGLTEALSWGATDVALYSDSKLMIMQAKRAFVVKEPTLQRLLEELSVVLAEFNSVELNWIGRGDNQEADDLLEDIVQGCRDKRKGARRYERVNA